MEQARLLLAIVLSLLVFLAWNYFFVEPQTAHKSQEVNKLQEQIESSSEKRSDDHPSMETKEEAESKVSEKNYPPVSDMTPAKIITIETPIYSAKISEKGAGIVSFILKDYRETVDPNSAQKELIHQNDGIKELTLFFEKGSIPDLQDRQFKALSENEKINVKDQPYELRFLCNTKKGVLIEKKFTFKPDSYLVDLDVIIHNNSQNIFSDQLGLKLAKIKEADPKQGYVFEGPSALIDGKHKQIKIKKDKTPEPLTGNVQWIAFEERYFITCLIMRNETQGNAEVKIGKDKLFNEFIGQKFSIDQGNSKKIEFSIFFGPKKQDLLAALDSNLSKLIDFGFFNFLAKPLLWFMNFIYSIIPNYGVAIIILTILMKMILWPLGTKSYKSMNDMKKLQPELEKIREKYKDDKNRMNQEIMGLYRTFKINPMGGCLPMVLQLPVFLALYRMLFQAIELRHAPFIWWINDLSAPDRLFRFDFSVPVMHPPYGIPVLTIIMGATMLLQQKMSPPPGDPAQAKMMMIMPVVFTFIFINFSSGLVLYWLVNNILSIGQQYYIQKKYA